MFFFSEFILNKVRDSQRKLSDILRAALFQNDALLFDLIEFDDDFIFLEPSLFCFFLSHVDNKSKIQLEQILFGYIKDEMRPNKLIIKSDIFGIVNLPNLGYLKIVPNTLIKKPSKFIEQNLISNTFATNSKIRLCLHPTDHFSNQSNGVFFDEPIELSLNNHINELNLAVVFFQKKMINFWNLIISCTREFVVFSSPNFNSFAGIQNHGTAYFNVEKTKKSVVFFIDDIAHQCGHIIFNAITLDTESYLKVNKDFPLKNYTSNPQELRGVYGAFHGLFTYTTILFSLNTFLSDKSNSDEVLIHEALGRIGFYLSKFKHDLKIMNNSDILTEKGLEFRKQFEDSFWIIYDKWHKSISKFDYSNQPYIFQYQIFVALNPIS